MNQHSIRTPSQSKIPKPKIQLKHTNKHLINQSIHTIPHSNAINGINDQQALQINCSNGKNSQLQSQSFTNSLQSHSIVHSHQSF